LPPVGEQYIVRRLFTGTISAFKCGTVAAPKRSSTVHVAVQRERAWRGIPLCGRSTRPRCYGWGEGKACGPLAFGPMPGALHLRLGVCPACWPGRLQGQQVKGRNQPGIGPKSYLYRPKVQLYALRPSGTFTPCTGSMARACAHLERVLCMGNSCTRHKWCPQMMTPTSTLGD